jgi:hypothetical protein
MSYYLLDHLIGHHRESGSILNSYAPPQDHLLAPDPTPNQAIDPAPLHHTIRPFRHLIGLVSHHLSLLKFCFVSLVTTLSLIFIPSYYK